MIINESKRINESNEYGLRYVMTNKSGKFISKEKNFKSDKDRKKFIDKLLDDDNFIRIDAYSDPKNESINSEPGFTYKGDHYTWDEKSQTYHNDNPKSLNQIYGKKASKLWNSVPKDAKWDEVNEDIVKLPNGKWANKGKSGKTHGEFDTKKEAEKQMRAMYANGFGS